MSTASPRGRSVRPSRGPAKIIVMPTPRVVRRRRARRATMGVLAVALLGALIASLYPRAVPPLPEEAPELGPEGKNSNRVAHERAWGMFSAILAHLRGARAVPLTPEEVAGLSAPEKQILELVNRERRRGGLKPLEFSARLAVMARGHSYDMAIRHYFAHDTPEGTTAADRMRGVRIGYRELAENIYMEEDRGSEDLPERALKGWLQSPEHRANLLSPVFTESGIGIARSSDGKSYVTQDFLR